MHKLLSYLSSTHIVQGCALLLIFLIPLQTRWIITTGELNDAAWEYGTFSLYAVDALIILLLFFLLIYAINHRKHIPLSLFAAVSIMLSVIAFFSLGFASNTKVGLFWWLQLSVGILLFLVFPLIPLSSQRIAQAFIASGVIQSIIGMVQFFRQSFPASTIVGISALDPNIPGAPVIEGSYGRVLRAVGTLPHPNILAGFLCVSLILALHLFLKAQSTKQQLIYAASMLIMSTALWMTFSRQAWLALAVIVSCVILHTFLTTQRFPGVLVRACLILLLPFVVLSAQFPDYVRTRIQASERLETKSLEDRASYLDQARTLLQEEWITGVGMANETIRVAQLDSTPYGIPVQPVHNIFILIFTELGIFGLIGILFFVLLLLASLRWERRSDRMWGFAFAALLIIGMFDHYLWSLHVGILLFWVIAGCSYAALLKPTENPQDA